MYRIIGAVSNYLAALILLSMSMIYLFKGSFLPYHSEALSMEWSELDSSLQHLILGLMRAVSGGLLAVSLVIIVLQTIFLSAKTPWIPLLILVAGLVISLSSLYAMLIVDLNTPGNPPTLLGLVGIGLLLAGFILNRISLRRG